MLSKNKKYGYEAAETEFDALGRAVQTIKHFVNYFVCISDFIQFNKLPPHNTK